MSNASTDLDCDTGQSHCAKKPVTTMLTYPWKCTVLHCNHLGNTWKPLVLMIRHFDYCPSTRCFPGGYNVKLYISRGRLAWWLLAFLHSVLERFLTCFSTEQVFAFGGHLLLRFSTGSAHTLVAGLYWALDHAFT